MGDEEEATLEGQFASFSRLLDNKRNGTSMTLWRSDYWMRQARLMDDRTLNMTDTGVVWFKLSKTELTFEEWYQFLTELCETKHMNQEAAEFALTNCGMPGTVAVTLLQFRDYFDTYKPKSKILF